MHIYKVMAVILLLFTIESGVAKTVTVTNYDTIEHSVQLLNDERAVTANKGAYTNVKPGETVELNANTEYHSILVLIDYVELVSARIPEQEEGGQIASSLYGYKKSEVSMYYLNVPYLRISKNGDTRAEFNCYASNSGQVRHSPEACPYDTQDFHLSITAGPNRVLSKDAIEEKLRVYEQEQNKVVAELEKKLNELTSAGSIEKAVHNEIKENNMVSEAVAEQLTPTTIADGVKKTLEETRLEHANDTSLPIGTFYVQGTEFNKDGYFKVWPAYNNGLLNCSNVGTDNYLIDMSDKNASELVSQIMGAYVTDTKLEVLSAVQLQNDDLGQYCKIKSVSLKK